MVVYKRNQRDHRIWEGYCYYGKVTVILNPVA